MGLGLLRPYILLCTDDDVLIYIIDRGSTDQSVCVHKCSITVIDGTEYRT